MLISDLDVQNEKYFIDSEGNYVCSSATVLNTILNIA